MSAAGKVCIGFSKPFVAKYDCTGGAVKFTNGMQLARGVSVSISPEVSDDNDFYADGILAESDSGRFTGGTATLTVDGLHQAAEKFIYGLPEPEEITYGENKKVTMTKYGANTEPPYVGIGVVVWYQSGGVVTYVPTILVKAKFKMNNTEAQTQENNEKNWQTQDLEAALHRDDSAKANWKYVGADMPTEAEAVAVIKGLFAVAEATAEG